VKQKDEILKLASENKGVVLTKNVTEIGCSRATLAKMVKEGVLTQIQRGVYVTDEGYIDDFFLLQQIFKKGIFSHETALYLLGFSDRVPPQITMTFGFGTSTSRMKNEGIKPIMVSNNFDVGRISLNRNGMEIFVYEIERTLVDLLKPKYSSDFEQLIPALKKYAQYEKRDINKLFRYSKIFGVEHQMRNYMGVLL